MFFSFFLPPPRKKKLAGFVPSLFFSFLLLLRRRHLRLRLAELGEAETVDLPLLDLVELDVLLFLCFFACVCVCKNREKRREKKERGSNQNFCEEAPQRREGGKKKRAENRKTVSLSSSFFSSRPRVRSLALLALPSV